MASAPDALDQTFTLITLITLTLLQLPVRPPFPVAAELHNFQASKQSPGFQNRCNVLWGAGAHHVPCLNYNHVHLTHRHSSATDADINFLNLRNALLKSGTRLFEPTPILRTQIHARSPRSFGGLSSSTVRLRPSLSAGRSMDWGVFNMTILNLGLSVTARMKTTSELQPLPVLVNVGKMLPKCPKCSKMSRE